MSNIFSKFWKRLFGSQKVMNVPYSLSHILLRSALLTYFLFALVITGIQFVIEYYSIKRDIMRQLQSLAQTFEPATVSALWDLDVELMEAVVNGMGANLTVVKVEVVDLDGEVKVFWRDPSMLKESSMLSVERKLYYRDNGTPKHLGSLKVSSSERVLFSLLKSKMKSILISDFILLLSFCLLMWLFIRLIVVKPLVQFSDQMTTLSKVGQGMPIDFDTEQVKEIKSLQESFNQLMQLLSKREELIWHQANFDKLTSLPNRHLFQDRLEQEAKKVARSGSSLALFFIDLDGFKAINDTSGHAMGDILLHEAGQRIAQCVRDTDTIARLGGDEYTVILPDFHERAYVERIAKDIVDAIAKPFDLSNGEVVYVSASIGIAIYPDDTEDLGELMKQADQAMYSVKEHGKNHFTFFALPMQLEVQDKLKLTSDLREALAKNEFEVHYQPIIDVKTGLIYKAEALLRWNHPTRGLVSPAVFIPLAEESRMIIEIGEWVFHEVIRNIKYWQKEIGRLIQVSVNMSPLQFELPSEELWLKTFRGSKLSKNSLTIEITEGLLIKDSIKVKQRLLDFRNKGIEVSIDDFGTGFSALSYLKQFDIDYLKIDRAFITNLTTDSSDKALTEAIIVMAHKLGIRTVAEGVETEAQRDLLVAFGCDYVQGYLYSRPVNEKEFEQLLKT
jgi:diguanylate cyclase (GGDEF)-like protein